MVIPYHHVMSLNLNLLRGQFLALELQAVNREREKKGHLLNGFNTVVRFAYLSRVEYGEMCVRAIQSSYGALNSRNIYTATFAFTALA